MNDAIFNEEIINKRIEELKLIEQGFNIARNEGKEYETFYAYSKSKNNQDWEILSFTWVQNNPNNLIWELQPNGLYKNNYGAEFTYYDMMHGNNGTFCVDNGKMKIHSVKVLSSGEIFSVGDKVADLIGDYYSDKSIAAFKIEGNNMFAIMNDLKGTFLIQHIKKHKPILFVTTDNVAIYEGDRFWVYSLYNESLSEQVAIKGYETPQPNLICFSTENAAKEYILMNKPCLSLNDVLNYYDSVVNRFADFRHGLKELVKNKINQ